jgi:hypothetical protein
VSLSQALRYPFQGERWFPRILALALLQLVPVAGQLILIGYGMAVARAVHAEQANLPALRWQTALLDGLRYLIAALLYVVPLLADLPTIFAIGTVASTSATGDKRSTWMAAIVLPVATVAVFPITRALQKRGGKAASLLARILSIVPILAIVMLIVTLFASGIDLSAARENLNALGIALLVALALLVFLLIVAVHIGAVQDATGGNGLFDPPGNLRLLLGNRAVAAKLILNFVLLSLIAILATSAGLLLLVLPGLFIFVVCVVAWWYLLARYAAEAS